MPKQSNAGKNNYFSTNAARTGYVCAKHKIWSLPHNTKIISEWIIDLTVRVKTIKLLEQNVRVNLHDHEDGHAFPCYRHGCSEGETSGIEFHHSKSGAKHLYL